MIEGRTVTNEEKIAILTQTKGSSSQQDHGGLVKDIKIAIGASVMVTLNIHIRSIFGILPDVSSLNWHERRHLILMASTQT